MREEQHGLARCETMRSRRRGGVASEHMDGLAKNLHDIVGVCAYHTGNTLRHRERDIRVVIIMVARISFHEVLHLRREGTMTVQEAFRTVGPHGCCREVSPGESIPCRCCAAGVPARSVSAIAPIVSCPSWPHAQTRAHPRAERRHKSITAVPDL